jgi:hypothetical protein
MSNNPKVTPMAASLPAQRLYSIFEEPVQFRAKLQTYTHLPPELVVRKVDASLEVDAVFAAYHRSLRFTRPGGTITMPPRSKRARDPLAAPNPENVLRAEFRAKQTMKTRIKELAPSALLTLTSRNLLGEISEAHAALAHWWRLVRLACPDGNYVAVVEAHQSGQLHLHLAIRGLDGLSYNTLRRFWHAALLGLKGEKCTRFLRGADAPGNVDVQHSLRGKVAGLAIGKHAGKIARYMGKYLSKDACSEFNGKRYTSSRGISVAKAQTFWLAALTLDAARAEALGRLGYSLDSANAVTFWTPGDHLACAVLEGLFPAPPA